MTDVVSRLHSSPAAPPPAYELIELLFFAYRAFVEEADAVLLRFGFGRAHHRVLHFVSRNPGLKVADLLGLLKITKQSLGRVLRDLVEQGFVEASEGPIDRRQRLLRVTPRGEQLALELALLQSGRLRRALAESGAGSEAVVVGFLTAMMDRGEAGGVLSDGDALP